MPTSVFNQSHIDEFEESLSGTLIRPDDPRYADARKVWNGAIDRYPSLIVRAISDG